MREELLALPQIAPTAQPEVAQNTGSLWHITANGALRVSSRPYASTRRWPLLSR